MSPIVYTRRMARIEPTYLDYERAEGHLRDGDPIGYHEMTELTGRSMRAVYKWAERRTLPKADGPKVQGRPTWRRRTFLAWAYRQLVTRDLATGEPLACHEEAEQWAAVVDDEATARLVDLDRRSMRNSA